MKAALKEDVREEKKENMQKKSTQNSLDSKNKNIKEDSQEEKKDSVQKKPTQNSEDRIKNANKEDVGKTSQEDVTFEEKGTLLIEVNPRQVLPEGERVHMQV